MVTYEVYVVTRQQVIDLNPSVRPSRGARLKRKAWALIPWRRT